jgi:hypothetical protein
MQSLKNKGPIPRGLYTIQSPRHSNNTGPYSMPLVPKGHNAILPQLVKTTISKI